MKRPGWRLLQLKPIILPILPRHWQAADAARQKQQEAVDAQKVIDEQIRLRSTAQQRYYALTTDNSLENRLEQEDEEHAEGNQRRG
ncbi:MAG: hypothetical protein ACLU99_01865 [Alphaproteobacteria bacterium]